MAFKLKCVSFCEMWLFVHGWDRRLVNAALGCTYIGLPSYWLSEVLGAWLGYYRRMVSVVHLPCFLSITDSATRYLPGLFLSFLHCWTHLPCQKKQHIFILLSSEPVPEQPAAVQRPPFCFLLGFKWVWLPPCVGGDSVRSGSVSLISHLLCMGASVF